MKLCKHSWTRPQMLLLAAFAAYVWVLLWCMRWYDPWRDVSQAWCIVPVSYTHLLGYLDELKKSTSGADNMRAQIKDYLEDAAKAKLSAEEARREVERLRREIGYLKENH